MLVPVAAGKTVQAVDDIPPTWARSWQAKATSFFGSYTQIFKIRGLRRCRYAYLDVVFAWRQRDLVCSITRIGINYGLSILGTADNDSRTGVERHACSSKIPPALLDATIGVWNNIYIPSFLFDNYNTTLVEFIMSYTLLMGKAQRKWCCCWRTQGKRLWRDSALSQWTW